MRHDLAFIARGRHLAAIRGRGLALESASGGVHIALAGARRLRNSKIEHNVRGEIEMVRLLIVWLINAVALLALPYVFTSIHVDSFMAALIAALVLGLINTLIRPLLVLLTLPATILTLGLFIFVINGLLFWLAGSFVEGFRVDTFWAGVFGAIAYSIISWILSALIPFGKSD